MSQIILGLWGAVVVGAVLGKIIDPSPVQPSEPYETEVISSHPEIEREQLEAWGREFFRVPAYHRTRPSRTEILEAFPRHFYSRGISDVDRDSSEKLHVFHTHRGQGRHELDNLRLQAMVKEENLEWMLKFIFSYPRNHNTNETAKDASKKYIVDSFQVTSGLETVVQHFQPIQFLNIYDDYSIPKGTNIIEVLKGREWGTANDRPVLVGAHYDTVTFSPGTDDNGSGVASMLEAARALSTFGCQPKYSIIFVAFDLEEVGSQGSLVFIKDYLSQVLQKSFPQDVPLARFQGAFILDTIMNFNDTEASQTFPTDWSLVLPKVYDEVADNHYKGDFLSMIYRKDVDFSLTNVFAKHWNKLSSSSSGEKDPFNLLSFPLDLGKDLPSMSALADHLNFLRSDHSRFWYMNDTNIPVSLNAVLMTDTGPYRGSMRNCYHTVCDGPEIALNPKNLKFLTKITQTLTNTLIDMSECQVVSTNQPKTNNDQEEQIFIKSSKIHAKSSSPRTDESPLRHLLNFVRWMEYISSPSDN